MPHRNLADEKPSVVMTAKALFDDFSKDETAGTKKYGNKAIEVSGNVVDVKVTDKDATIVLTDASSGVTCAFDSATVVENKAAFQKIKIGDASTVRGQCDGLDMIQGVMLSRSVLVK
jgi:RecJ-like exonuclease